MCAPTAAAAALTRAKGCTIWSHSLALWGLFGMNWILQSRLLVTLLVGGPAPQTSLPSAVPLPWKFMRFLPTALGSNPRLPASTNSDCTARSRRQWTTFLEEYGSGNSASHGGAASALPQRSTDR
jgi:hypothetical protein